MAGNNTGTDSGPVFRLVYRSQLCVSEDERKEEVSKILAVARTKNEQQGITGALVVWEDSVVQTLEGDESSIRSLYEKIQRDPRHENVEVVDESTGNRAFGRWSMAWISDDDQPDLPLNPRQHEKSSGIQFAQFSSPEEDAAVRAMRDRVRGASA